MEWSFTVVFCAEVPIDFIGCLVVYSFVFCVLEIAITGGDQAVRHRCQDRLCLNPDHLVAGTQADNKRDDWEYAAGGIDFDLL